MSIETIEVDTGLEGCTGGSSIRIHASDLVILAKAMKGHPYIDVWTTDGVRRIANPHLLLQEPPNSL